MFSFKKIFVSFLIIIIILLSYLFINQYGLVNIEHYSKNKLSNSQKIYVEIRGEVKQSGVYEMNDNSTISDLIQKSGGFIKTANYQNLLLETKLNDGMLIYIERRYDTLVIKESPNLNVNYNLNFNNKKLELVSYSENNPNDSKINNEQIDQEKKDNENIELKDTDMTDNKDQNTGSGALGEPNSDTNKDKTPIDNNHPTIININLADLNQLMLLPGIGKTKAIAIINYRNTNGMFNKIEDLLLVSGIGEKTYNDIKTLISVGGN